LLYYGYLANNYKLNAPYPNFPKIDPNRMTIYWNSDFTR